MNISENIFPFLFLGHGPINPHYLDKSEECFIWFKRPVEASERYSIMHACPKPLAGFFYWADEFVHFGTGGDSYDLDVLSEYCDKEYRIDLIRALDGDEKLFNSGKFDIVMNETLDRFAKAFEEWVLKSNGVVPIAFVIGPAGASSSDPWHKWSCESIGSKALSYVSAFIELNEKTLRKAYKYEDRKIIEINSGCSSWAGIMSPAEMTHVFSNISTQLADTYIRYSKTKDHSPEDLNNLLKAINFIYLTDGIYEPVSTLSFSDRTLKHNASLLESVLSRFEQNKRIIIIDSLDPYTQLAFYCAKYSTSSLLTSYPDAVNYLKKIINAIQGARVEVVPSMIVFAANNLAKIGPAFDEKYDLTYGRIAAEIMTLTFEYRNGPLEAFMNSAFIYDQMKDYEGMLNVSLKGYERYPDDAKINANILYSAQKLGREDIVEKFAKSSEELALTDPLLLMNQSYTLISKGELAKAKEMINLYAAKGGKLTPELLTNIIYTYTVNNEDDGKREFYLLVLMNFIRGEGNRKFKTNPDLVCNATIVLNNLKRNADSDLVLDTFVSCGGKLTAGLYNQFIYNAIESRDSQRIRNAYIQFTEKLNDGEKFFDGHSYIFASASNCTAIERDAGKTINWLKIAKNKGFDISYVKNEPDYEFLKGNKEFLGLF